MLRNLSTGDKIEVAIITIVMLFCTVVVILAISWSNGRDLLYFKERVILMEYRMNALDKKQSEVTTRNETLVDKTNELIKSHNALEIRTIENEKWIEHWKSLPSLPKPKEKR
jgi:hypothetical protein